MQHCQNEDFFRCDYTPQVPITHSYNQTKWGELFSCMEQIRNARDANFQGIFYAVHASTPEGIEFLMEEKRQRHPFRIIIETTASNEFLNYKDYRIHGNRIKMNPALRSPKDQARVLEHVLEGHTDVAADDHAPHPLYLKDMPQEGKFPPSGIPGILFLPKRVELWRKLGMSENTASKLLFGIANNIFQLGLEKKQVKKEYHPELWATYGWNPFSRVDGTYSTEDL